MQLGVTTPTGETMAAAPCETVAAVKARIGAEVGIPPERQRLTFGGADLEDGRTLAHYRIPKGSTLHLLYSLDGGGPMLKMFSKSRVPNLKHLQHSVIITPSGSDSEADDIDDAGSPEVKKAVYIKYLNKLRDHAGAQGIDVPQIVVVGD